MIGDRLESPAHPRWVPKKVIKAVRLRISPGCVLVCPELPLYQFVRNCPVSVVISPGCTHNAQGGIDATFESA
jgi:hypothetical protein